MLKFMNIIIGIVIFAILIKFSSQIDSLIAIMPFDYKTNVFYGEITWWTKFVFVSIPVVTILIILLSITRLFWARYKNYKDYPKIKRATIIILVSLALGPGLIAGGFKDHWGRPRPRQVIREHANYHKFWHSDFNKPANNSFVSGHATIGFFLGVPFLAFGYRRRGLIIGLIGGSFVGFVRILQGGHYLSDVIFAGVVVWLSAEFIIFVVDKFLSIKNRGFDV